MSWAFDVDDNEYRARQLKSMHDQLCQLKELLQHQYAFQTEEWHLQRTGSRGNFGTRLAALTTAQDQNKDNTLLILYYAGHGAVDNNSHLLWRW
jgi:hypothetical protein